MFDFFARSLLAYSMVAEAPASDTTCDISVEPQQLFLRHIEAKGVGYDQGYTTLEGLFASNNVNALWIPFVDVRGHIFNNGKLAANAGLGMRYVDSMVWGLNAYYDFRQTQHHNYKQIGIGFEALGKIWDFRWNGYFPVGKTHSSWYDTKFHSFKGHSLYLSSKREFVMAGTNAEVGAHFYGGRHTNLYGALGPYYFAGNSRQAWGAEARLMATLYDYFSVQLSGSYDQVFKGIVQGEISFRIPLGNRKNVASRIGTSCQKDQILRQKAYQKIDRNEIIVADRKRKKSVAINPATGNPYFFWFVNNTSHSAGTFESPYPTLRQAIDPSHEYDIVYIFPGDGTTTGLSAETTPYQLKNDQQVWGAGHAQTLSTTKGGVTIPALANNLPHLTAADDHSILTLATNNTVSGLHFTLNDEGSHPYAIGKTGGFSGAIIANNQFDGTGVLHFILFDHSSNAETLPTRITEMYENTFQGDGSEDGQAIAIKLDGTDFNSSTTATFMIHNNMTNNLQLPLYITGEGSSSAQYFIFENTPLSDASGIVIYLYDESRIVQARMTNNNFNCPSSGVSITANSSSQSSAHILNNTFINSSLEGTSANNATLCLEIVGNQAVGSSGIDLTQLSSSSFYLQPLSGNNMPLSTSGTITNVPVHFCN